MKTIIDTMKAITISSFGEASVLKEHEISMPRPKGKELLVRVHATSVNPVDCKIRNGLIKTGADFPQILGFDVSGVVEEIGKNVTDFKVGDEVYYLPRIIGWQGAYAEYHLVEEEIVAKKPINLSHTEAAAIPLVGCTAWDALIERAKIKIGETVLIHAGAGGVGSIAIQLAKISGAHVFATCSSKNADFVKSLGADFVIDYKKNDFVEVIQKQTEGKGIDVVFDTVGGEVFERSLNVIRPFGRLTSIVRGNYNLEPAFYKNINIYSIFVQSARYKLDVLRDLSERKLLKPVIDSVMLLNEVKTAHEKLENGGIRGKIVLKIK